MAMASPLTNVQKNATFGRPGAVKATNVTNRLNHLPRRSNGQVQVVLAHPLIADVFVDAYNAACDASGWIPQRCDSQVIRPWRNWKKPRGWKIGDRGTSDHSWAIAFDIMRTPADVSPPGGVWTPHDEVPAAFVAEFEKRGFFWGGRWKKRRDTPHFEFRGQPTKTVRLDPADWLTEMLKQGDIGAGVRNLQFGLMMLGLKEVEPTGTFGPETDTAVRGLQGMAGVEVDGLVGPTTERVIYDLWAKHLPTPMDMVTQAYRLALGRKPDGQGGKFWAAQVVDGKLLASDLLRRIWDSPGRALELAKNAEEKPIVKVEGEDVVELARRALELLRNSSDHMESVEARLVEAIEELS